MKTFFTTGILCLFLIFGVRAQQKRVHEIQVGAGLAMNEFRHLRFITDSFRYETSPRLENLNGMYITYRWGLSRNFSIGIANGITQSFTLEGGSAPTYRSFMFAIEPQIRYFQRPLVTLYGSAGLGGVLTYVEGPSAQRSGYDGYFTPLALQLTPIGVRYGKTFGVFAEAGYGYKGIVNVGMSARF